MEGATYFVTRCLRREQPELAPAERSAIAAALRHYDGDRYRLAGYVVMNDHVHAVVEPAAGHRLEAIVQGLEVIPRSPPMQGNRSRKPALAG